MNTRVSLRLRRRLRGVLPVPVFALLPLSLLHGQGQHAADHVGWETCPICRARSSGGSSSSSGQAGAQSAAQDFQRWQQQQREQQFRETQRQNAARTQAAAGIANIFMNLATQDEEDEEEEAVAAPTYPSSTTTYSPAVTTTTTSVPRAPVFQPAPPEPAKPLFDFRLSSLASERTEEEVRNEQVLRDLGRGGSTAPASPSPTFTPIGPSRLTDYTLVQRFDTGVAEGAPRPPAPSLLEMVVGHDNAQALEERWEDKKADLSGKWQPVKSLGGNVAAGTAGALLDQTISEMRSGEHSGSWSELSREAFVSTAKDQAASLGREAIDIAYQNATPAEKEAMIMRQGAASFPLVPFARDGAEDTIHRVGDLITSFPGK